MLIDSSYFTKAPRHILNATIGTIPTPNAKEVCEAINSFISTFQLEFLTRMLGNKVGMAVQSHLEGCSHGPLSDEYDELCRHLRESFADYIFYKFLGDTTTQATLTGPVRIKSANTYVAPIDRQVQTWNTMVNRNRIFREWVKSDCKITGIEISDAMLTKINNLNL